jgi:hypothetical protein
VCLFEEAAGCACLLDEVLVRQVTEAEMGKIACPGSPVAQSKVAAIKLLYSTGDKSEHAMLSLLELAYKCMIVAAAGDQLTPASVGYFEEIETRKRGYGGKVGENWSGINRHLKESVDRRLETIARAVTAGGLSSFPKLTQRDINHILKEAWMLIYGDSSGCPRILESKAMGEETWKGDASDRKKKNRARIYIENRWCCKTSMVKKRAALAPKPAALNSEPEAVA